MDMVEEDVTEPRNTELNFKRGRLQGEKERKKGPGQSLLNKGTDLKHKIHLKAKASGLEQRKFIAQRRNTAFERQIGVVFFKQHFEITVIIPLSKSLCYEMLVEQRFCH